MFLRIQKLDKVKTIKITLAKLKTTFILIKTKVWYNFDEDIKKKYLITNLLKLLEPLNCSFNCLHMTFELICQYL